MAKYIDPTNLKMLGGALAGGALMEDEQDFTGTALGLAVGGFTGSMLDLDFKNIEKVKKQTNFKIKSDVPEKEIDTLRESMLDEIRTKRAKLQPNQNKIYEHLVSDPSITFNAGDAFNTITNENGDSVLHLLVQEANLNNQNEVLLLVQRLMEKGIDSTIVNQNFELATDILKQKKLPALNAILTFNSLKREQKIKDLVNGQNNT